MNLINNGNYNILTLSSISNDNIDTPDFTFVNPNSLTDIISVSFIVFGHGDCSTVGSI